MYSFPKTASRTVHTEYKIHVPDIILPYYIYIFQMLTFDDCDSAIITGKRGLNVKINVLFHNYRVKY